MRSLQYQAAYLAASWREAQPGYPRLLALIGLVQTTLCIAENEAHVREAEQHLIDELKWQILPDGGHASRDPAVLIDLLLELLPLRQCFLARDIGPNQALGSAIERMITMLHRLRLGDGELARFNGMGVTPRDSLATVLAYGKDGFEADSSLFESGYPRLQRGTTVVLADAGPPPPADLGEQACAGCLSFEMSVGSEPMLVNAGAPGPAHERYRAASRGTSSHNSLVLNGQSSTQLAHRDEAHLPSTARPISPLRRVTCAVQEAEDGGLVFDASHDGYADRFKLIHSRTLTLSVSGERLDGRDTLSGAKTEMRFAWDVPFAIHFHLHPHCGARAEADGSAELILPSGTRWRLSTTGATLTVEESTYFSGSVGPLRSQQVVLRAVCYGKAEVTWTLERVGPTEQMDVDAQLAEVRAILAEDSVMTEGQGAIQAPGNGETDTADPTICVRDKPA